MIKGILFDVDGVIFDSEVFIRQAYKSYYKAFYNIELTDRDLELFVGTGEEASICGFGEKYSLDYNIERDKDGIYESYGTLIKGKLKYIEGALKFIENARRAGLRLALATSADRRKLNYSMSETGLSSSLFDFIVTGDMVTKTKPDGSIYRYASAGLVLDNSQCLVVEDAISGHNSAKNAGSPSLGIKGSFSENELILAGADLVIDNFSFFPNFSTLDEFNRSYEDGVSSFIKKTVIGSLIDTASKTMKNAYTPYSSFNVGAAILTEKGNIYGGCNVENASYGATICAERGAGMVALAAEGKTEFKALAVVSESDEPAPPCALCRQFLTEFAKPQMQVYLYSTVSGVLRHYNFASLMPFVFELT